MWANEHAKQHTQAAEIDIVPYCTHGILLPTLYTYLSMYW